MNHKSLVFILALLFAFAAQAHFKEPGKNGMIIAEWDLAFPSEEKLQQYFASRPSNKLIVARVNGGTFDVWNKRDRFDLTYCISNEFGRRKKDVIEAMKVATGDWMDAGGLRFSYVSREDGRCDENNKRVMFDVRPVNFGHYIARAFFPSYPRENRNILIDSSAFEYSFVAMSGFLRHELGHVLGFRHEHISRRSNGQCRETGDFYALTSYDRLSVMHYPQCGGNNNLEDMILSEMDKSGVMRVYPL